MDSTAVVTTLGLAAEYGGAAGLRIEGAKSVHSLAQLGSLPIIGIIKHSLIDSPVRITPHLDDVDALADAGATIIAYDATQRDRPVPTAEIVARIQELGLLAMADCARVEDGQQALSLLDGLHALDLLITDVGLPGLNGRQLAEIIQQKRPSLPVLFISGYAENAAIRSEFLGVGMSMMTKPFTLEHLAATVSAAFEGRAAPGAV